MVPFFPMLGVLTLGFFGKRFSEKNQGIFASSMVFLSFLVSLLIFANLLALPTEARHYEQNLFTWIPSGTLQAEFGFLVDPLSVIMILVVTGVGFLIHVYSIGYMHGDAGNARYFTFLNLFTFSMLLLVLSNNFLLMFIGWEGVGLCSYLLIGFWFEDEEKAIAGKKAFIVNRIGDLGFILAMMLIFTIFGTLNFGKVFEIAPEMFHTGNTLIVAITLLLFVGATGKSAQIPLYIWLPDAMAGPTPVSALIHAATMVTAGVYLIARTNALYLLAPFSMGVVATIGALTAIFAATIGICQTDLKKILAYSTISQLGYMFLGVGVGAFSAGIFHLMTHAFFKALLFLGAGSVIHALSGEQNILRMGGLRKALPHTCWTFLLATLAISGIPGFSGFFSKDEILWQAFSSPHGSPLLWLIGATAAGITAFYMFRLVFMTFFGESRLTEKAKAHLHESPKVMIVPLMILAVLSVFGGYIGVPAVLGGANHFHHFMEPVIKVGYTASEYAQVHGTAALEMAMMVISVLIALFGIYLAYSFYLKKPMEIPQRISKNHPNLYSLVFNKYFVDEIYDKYIIQPLHKTYNFMWKVFDIEVIDGFVNSLAQLIMDYSERLRRLQTGYIRNYALSIALGVIIVIWYLAFLS